MSNNSTNHHQPKKSSFFWGLVVPLLLIWLIVWWLMCQFCCDERSKPDDALATVPTDIAQKATGQSVASAAAPFMIRFSDAFNTVPEMVESETFRFAADSYQFKHPVSGALQVNLNSVKSVLAANPMNRLTLTGRFRADEKNTSAFPSLGLARANTVKSHLVSQGYDASQITLADSLDNYVSLNTDKLYDDRVSFDVSRMTAAEIVNEDIALQEVGNEIRENPLVLNFEVGEAYINLSEAQRKKMLNIVRYLDQNPDAKVNIIGHTDNQGKKAANFKLGQERADFASGYLQKNGLNKSRIIATSKGETQPIADNQTESGKQKNRRTVVTLH